MAKMCPQRFSVLVRYKVLYTQSENGSENRKDQEQAKDHRINDKDQRKFSLPLHLSLGVNESKTYLATEKVDLTRKSSCVNARGIPPAV